MSEAQDKQPEAGKGAEDTPPSADSKNADKGKQQELTVPKARLDEVIAERNALKAEKQAAQDAIQAAEEAKKLEQGKYQELYEKAQADAEKAANELAKLQSDALKRNVATEGGYPGLWDRISGATEEELKADLDILVGAFPTQKTPNIDAGTGSGARSGEQQKEQMSEARKKELAALLGVNPAYMPDTPINI
jgi:hypothetical protein